MTRRSYALLALLVLLVVGVGGLRLRSSDAWWKYRSSAHVAAYVADHPVRKLQLGTGDGLLDGWLNTDIFPGAGLVYLDATEPFPIADGTFRYVHSEHVIEHLPFESGMHMLAESYRILEPGGKVRVTTPDLDVFLRLADADETPEEAAYMKGKLAWHGWTAGPKPAITILNLQLRSWGHMFVYDPATLEACLRQVGFRDVRRFKPGESDDPGLQGVEVRRGSDISQLNEFESMTYQATK